MMTLDLTNIFPVEIASGNITAQLSKEDFVALQDAVENLSADTHENLRRPQSPPAATDTTLFLNTGHKQLMRIKELFHDACVSLHENKYPALKGKLQVHDSICRGIVINSLTTVQDVMSNYPWHYTGFIIIRAPDGLPQGEGDIVFVDPLPVSEAAQSSGLTPKKGNVAIVPGWLKYRFRPISFKQEEYDTVMILVMNAFVAHERFEDYEAKTRNRSGDNSETGLFQLGPTGERGETDIGFIDVDDSSGDTDIGKF